MDKRVLTCIRCPLGCQIEVTLEVDAISNIHGNTCPRGEEYARKEITNPTRVVTSIVAVENGTLAVTSGKTKADIPKDKIFACLEELKKVCVKAPVKTGDILVADIAGTGIDFISTKDGSAVK